MALRDKLRAQALQKWPLLRRLGDLYFNEDRDIMWGTIEEAMAQAVRDYSVGEREAVLREWEDWSFSESLTDDLRGRVNDGLGFNILFKSDNEAKDFMIKVRDSFKDVPAKVAKGNRK